MVSTFEQPDYTAQSGSAYKANIDAAAAVHNRLAGPFAPHEQDQGSPTPDMTVRLDAGFIPRIGAKATAVAAQDTATITAPSSNPRYDIVYVDAQSGSVGVATGTEDPAPSDPAVPAGKVAVARVSLTTGMTAITNADITDLRNLGMLNVGTAAGNLVALDSSAKLPAVDGSQLTGIEAGAAESDMRLAFLRIAENAGDRLNMVDGIADPYADESDVDTAASSGQIYNSAGDYYSGASETEDGTWGTSGAGSVSFGDASANRRNIGLQFTASQTGTITEAKVNVQTVGNSFTAHAELWTDSSGSPGSQVGTDSNQVNLNSIGEKTFTFASPPSVTNSTTYWLVIVDDEANGSGDVQIQYIADDGSFSSGNHDTITSISTGVTPAGGDWRISITNAVSQDMTLASAAFTADSARDIGRLAVQAKPNESITVNTDLIGWMSRYAADFTTDYAADANQLDATAHGLANDDRVFLRSSGTLPAGLSAGVAYYVVNATTNALELSLTSGGAAVTLTDDGSGTHTMIAVTQATLAATEVLEDGTTMYEDADIDLTGQPSGTAMRRFVQTLNSKDIEDHGLVLQWA